MHNCFFCKEALVHGHDATFSLFRHKNNFYPGEVTSFSVSRDGSKMAVCNKGYPDAKIIDCKTGNVDKRLYDTFAAGSQPLSVSRAKINYFMLVLSEGNYLTCVVFKKERYENS